MLLDSDEEGCAATPPPSSLAVADVDEQIAASQVLLQSDDEVDDRVPPEALVPGEDLQMDFGFEETQDASEASKVKKPPIASQDSKVAKIPTELQASQKIPKLVEASQDSQVAEIPTEPNGDLEPDEDSQVAKVPNFQDGRKQNKKRQRDSKGLASQDFEVAEIPTEPSQDSEVAEIPTEPSQDSEVAEIPTEPVPSKKPKMHEFHDEDPQAKFNKLADKLRQLKHAQAVRWLDYLVGSCCLKF